MWNYMCTQIIKRKILLFGRVADFFRLYKRKLFSPPSLLHNILLNSQEWSTGMTFPTLVILKRHSNQSFE